MNLIFVKHDGDNKHYLFTLPNRKQIPAGVKVICQTLCGEASGITTSHSFRANYVATQAIAEEVGAYLPLKPIIGEVVESVKYFKQEPENPEVKEVKRIAEIGEYVKAISTNLANGGGIKAGEIYEVISNALGQAWVYVRSPVSSTLDGCCASNKIEQPFSAISDYVVLENYRPSEDFPF